MMSTAEKHRTDTAPVQGDRERFGDALKSCIVKGENEVSVLRKVIGAVKWMDRVHALQRENPR